MPFYSSLHISVLLRVSHSVYSITIRIYRLPLNFNESGLSCRGTCVVTIKQTAHLSKSKCLYNSFTPEADCIISIVTNWPTVHIKAPHYEVTQVRQKHRTTVQTTRGWCTWLRHENPLACVLRSYIKHSLRCGSPGPSRSSRFNVRLRIRFQTSYLSCLLSSVLQI